MFYVKLDSNGQVIQYPYTLTDLRRENPNTSFTKVIDNEIAAAFNIFPVEPATQPVIDYTENLERQVEYVDGAWRERWDIVSAPELQIEQRKQKLVDYKLFWNLLIASPIYQNIRTQACTDLTVNTCCTEFIAAITDAKYGNPNINAIQACINLLVAALTLTEEDITELVDLFEQSKLDLIYSITF